MTIFEQTAAVVAHCCLNEMFCHCWSIFVRFSTSKRCVSTTAIWR